MNNKSINKHEMVVLKVYENEMEAEMVLELLKSNNIKSLIIKEDPAGMGLKREARLMVLKEDYEIAKKLLNKST